MTLKELRNSIQKLKNLLSSTPIKEVKELAFELLNHKEIHDDSLSLAKIYNVLGIISSKELDYSKSIEYYLDAIRFYKNTEYKKEIARNLGNIGLVYIQLSDNLKALEYYSKALQINEEIGDKEGISKDFGSIGVIYGNLSDYENALLYYSKALYINEEIENKTGYANNLGNIGIIYSILKDFHKALEYVFRALSIFIELDDKKGIATNLGNIGFIYAKLEENNNAIEYSLRALKIFEEIDNKHGIATNLKNIGSIYAKKESLLYDSLKAEEYLQKALVVANEIKAKDVVITLYEYLHLLRINEGLFQEALEYYKKSVEIDKEFQSEEAKNKAQLFDHRRKLEEDEKSRQLKLARFKEQEKILHNILPVNIADRILNQETFIADYFSSASVLFFDIVNFTSLSSITPPKQLVYLLDEIFQKADEVLDQFGLEKIKTIGDGYLAVANVTSPLEEHQRATALAALQLLETMKNFTVTMPTNLGDTNWIKDMNDIEIRIGIHTGEVVAGIIGKNKYTYDLWGDAVNIASRMESHSEAGRIHISEEFAKSIESYPEFSLIPRGEITIKGKGTMNTFWLEKVT